jgi:site-specific DNA-methyltransferase (adenine-specific)
MYLRDDCSLLPGDYADNLTCVGNSARMVFTSPPYNIGSKQMRSIGGRQAGGFDAKSFSSIWEYPDEMDEVEYRQSQQDFIHFCFENILRNDGVLVYNHKDRRKDGCYISPLEWILPLKASGIEIFDTVVWNRLSSHNNGATIITPTHEYLYIIRRAGRKVFFDKPRYEDSVSRLIAEKRKAPYVGTPMKSVVSIPFDTSVREGDEMKHNAPFPVPLAELFINAFSSPGELVCDPYSGSGTTGVAAIRTGRAFVGTEREEKYYLNACARLQKEISIKREEVKCTAP